MLKPLFMSQCCSMDYMKGYNAAIEKANAHIAELEAFRRKVTIAWEAHKDCGPECSLNDELEVILNP